MKHFLYFVFVVGLFACLKQKTQADLIIYGGKIYTAEENHPFVEAVAVKGDKILFAGTELPPVVMLRRYTVNWGAFRGSPFFV